MKRSRTVGLRVGLRLYLIGRGGSRDLAAAGGPVLSSTIASPLQSIRLEGRKPANAACHAATDAKVFQARHDPFERRRVPFCGLLSGVTQIIHREPEVCASPAQLAVRVLNGHLPKQVSRIPLPHGLPVCANRTACEKLSQLKEVNSTSLKRTTLELQLCETAVYASLAPAQPPPPAGLASSPLVLFKRGPLLVPSWSPFGPKLVPFWSQVGPMLVPKAVYRSGGPKAQTQFATTCRWAFERKQRQLAIPNAIPNFAKTMTDVAMAHEMNETVLAQQDMEDAVESSRCASQALAPGVPAIFVAQCIPRGVVTGHPGPSPCRTLRGGSPGADGTP